MLGDNIWRPLSRVGDSLIIWGAIELRECHIIEPDKLNDPCGLSWIREFPGNNDFPKKLSQIVDYVIVQMGAANDQRVAKSLEDCRIMSPNIALHFPYDMESVKGV